MVDSHESRSGANGEGGCRLNCLLLGFFNDPFDFFSSQRNCSCGGGRCRCSADGGFEGSISLVKRIGGVAGAGGVAFVVLCALARAQGARTASAVAIDHFAAGV